VKQVPIVVVWAIAFAYVESAIVEYLRAIYYPLERGGFQFPVLTIEQLQALGDEHFKRLLIELGREFSTLVMLLALGAAVGRNFRQAVAHFMIAFGVWDIFFYLWLKVLLDWPANIITWDLLFLLPVPWVGPVLAPVIISAAMIVSGLVVLFFESRGMVLATTWRDWLFLTVGGITVIVSFCLDYRNIMEGGLPNPFNWPVFFLGLFVSGLTFLLVIRRNLRAELRDKLTRSSCGPGVSAK
jgi:hypothetical protein